MTAQHESNASAKRAATEPTGATEKAQRESAHREPVEGPEPVEGRLAGGSLHEPPAGDRPFLLVIDDQDLRRTTLTARLELLGYRTYGAASGRQALQILAQRDIALVLFDVTLPEMDGEEFLGRRESDPRLRDIPFVAISGVNELAAASRYIELGAEDYVTRPFDPVLLQARIGACLERKRLRVLVQPDRNAGERGGEPMGELERLARLRRFFSPQLAELISSSGNESMLASHRREITVAFCDLRGFTTFAETAEPEDVMGVLREYHAAMGEIVFQHEGTLERFAGDGMMVFFNDPVPVPEPAAQAVRMAVAMRARASQLDTGWRKRGYDLGFGMGIAMGYATLGRIGFEGRFDYGAIGSVTNLASRLCDEAAAGQILMSRRVCSVVEDLVEVEPIGHLQLKGFQRPIEAFNAVRLRG